MNARVILCASAVFVFVCYMPVAAALALCAGMIATVFFGAIALLLVAADECPVTWYRKR